LIGQNREAIPKQARRAERASRPQANGLTALLCPTS
jgi:hypothetical protein